jgi:hypothetical protein
LLGDERTVIDPMIKAGEAEAQAQKKLQKVMARIPAKAGEAVADTKSFAHDRNPSKLMATTSPVNSVYPYMVAMGKAVEILIQGIKIAKSCKTTDDKKENEAVKHFEHAAVLSGWVKSAVYALESEMVLECKFLKSDKSLPTNSREFCALFEELLKAVKECSKKTFGGTELGEEAAEEEVVEKGEHLVAGMDESSRAHVPCKKFVDNWEIWSKQFIPLLARYISAAIQYLKNHDATALYKLGEECESRLSGNHRAGALSKDRTKARGADVDDGYGDDVADED